MLLVRFEIERRFERAAQSVSETWQLKTKKTKQNKNKDNYTAKVSSNLGAFFFHLNVVALKQERKAGSERDTHLVWSFGGFQRLSETF